MTPVDHPHLGRRGRFRAAWRPDPINSRARASSARNLMIPTLACSRSGLRRGSGGSDLRDPRGLHEPLGATAVSPRCARRRVCVAGTSGARGGRACVASGTVALRRAESWPRIPVGCGVQTAFSATTVTPITPNLRAMRSFDVARKQSKRFRTSTFCRPNRSSAETSSASGRAPAIQPVHRSMSFLMPSDSSPATTMSASWSRPPGLRTRTISRNAGCLSAARLSTPLEITISIVSESTGS